MTEKSQIAIYISLGSLVVSALSFLFLIRQSKIAKKNERARVYDKVYHDASDLLLYHYKNEQESTFESEDKDLERAVNEFSSAHWIEQTYGFNFYIPEHTKSEEDKREFCNKVREAYHAHERDKQTRWLDEFININLLFFIWKMKILPRDLHGL